jgi:hypothetical protein
MIKWLALLIHMHEVLITQSETGYSDSQWPSSVPPGKY